MAHLANLEDIIQVITWCLDCHEQGGGGCDRHRYVPPQAIESRQAPALHQVPVSHQPLVHRPAPRPTRGKDDAARVRQILRLPVELQIQIFGRMSPETFLSLLCVVPEVRELYHSSSAMITKLILKEHLSLEDKLFGLDNNYGFLWEGHATTKMQLLILFSLLEKTSMLAADFLIEHFNIAKSKTPQFYRAISTLWLLFATTPACQDRLQEPWNYFHTLSHAERRHRRTLLLDRAGDTEEIPTQLLRNTSSAPGQRVRRVEHAVPRGKTPCNELPPRRPPSSTDAGHVR